MLQLLRPAPCGLLPLMGPGRFVMVASAQLPLRLILPLAVLGHVRTNLQTSEVDIPAVLSPYGIINSFLFGMDDGWISSVIQRYFTPPDRMRSTYCTYFRRRRCSYKRQRRIFHTNAVGVSQFIYR